MHRSIRSRTGSAETRRWPIVLGVICAAAVLWLGRPALAADEEEAKLHFEKAQLAYKLGHYKEAIRGYEAAYRAMPEAAFLFNIAQSHRQEYRLTRKMFHLQKALSLYKSYLREIPKATNRPVVLNLIEELKSLLTNVEDNNKGGDATVILRGEQAKGATVLIDGKKAGIIPMTQKLKPGVHVIKVSKKGYTPWSSSVTVEAGSKMDLPVLLQSTSRKQTQAGPAETPVYKKWWFWTIIGVAVAGGAGTGIYFATRGDDYPPYSTIDLR